MLGLECPRDKRRKPAGFVLQIAQPLEVTNAMMNRLSHANHHRAGGAESQTMRLAMNHQPFVGFTFERADVVSDFIIEDLAATTRHGVEASGLEASKDIRHTDFRNPSDVQNFRGRETMTVNLEALFDTGQQALVVIDFQIG